MKSKIHHNIVLGMDPSGSYLEGYGTTGWCVVDCNTLQVLECGDIYAKDYRTRVDYWQAHTIKIRELRGKYHDLKVLSIEQYILYPGKAAEQSLSQLETPRLLGILELWCAKAHIEYFTRNAIVAKKRWTDEILVKKGILEQRGTKLYAAGRMTNDHIRDSIRHAIHFSVFENGGEKDD